MKPQTDFSRLLTVLTSYLKLPVKVRVYVSPPTLAGNISTILSFETSEGEARSEWHLPIQALAQIGTFLTEIADLATQGEIEEDEEIGEYLDEHLVEPVYMGGPR